MRGRGRRTLVFEWKEVFSFVRTKHAEFKLKHMQATVLYHDDNFTLLPKVQRGQISFNTMAGHGEVDIDAQKGSFLYQSVLTLLFTLNSAEMKSIDRQEEAREKINHLIDSIIIEMGISFGFTPDVSSDLQSRSTERASEVIQDLLEEFGFINHLEQEIYTTSKKRRRIVKDTVHAASDISTETPVDQYDNASALEQNNGEDCWEDDLVNESVFSPMAKVNPMEIENRRQTFVEDEKLEYAVYSAQVPDRDNDCDLDNHPARFDQRQPTEGFEPAARIISTPSTSAEKCNGNGKASPEFFTPSQDNDNADGSTENALPTERHAGGRNSEMTISSASSSSSFSSAAAMSTYSTAAAKRELDSMQNDFKKNGIAAGNPLVPQAVRIIIENLITSGNLSGVLEYAVPMLNFLQAKATCSKEYAMHKQQSANRLLLTTVPVIWDKISCGEVLCQLVETKSYEDIPSESENWTRIAFAIKRHNVDLDERIKTEKYCVVSRLLKNLLIIYFNLCLTINAMSFLRLGEFCDRNLLRDAHELRKEVLPNTGVPTNAMTARQFSDDVLAAALVSEDESLVATAVHVACMMRQQMTDEIVRPKFDAAQQMRLDGKGSCEGRNFCGGANKAQSTRRSDMLNLLFSILLGRQIQAEFRPGFFDLHGSFVHTILRGSWRDIEDKCNLLPKKEFFTGLFSFNYDKNKAITDMEQLIQRTADDRMAIVIFDEEQLQCLKKICLAIK
eukprot:scaffold37987_cov259-Skeletonema_marinoi.AAC.1